jgi:hypothetical protein
MDKIDLLKDPWVKCNYGDRNHHQYLNPDFEAGVVYAEQKVIDKVINWVTNNLNNQYINTEQLIKDLKIYIDY